MSSPAKPSARDLRQRAERHRLLAKQISDGRAAQALKVAAAQEAAEAAELEKNSQVESRDV
jgi:hypothetical protein